MDKIKSRLNLNLLVILVMAFIALIYPYFAASSFSLVILASALIFGLLAISLDLLWGYGGLLTLGPAAYFGLGGYIYALYMTKVGSGTIETLSAFLLSIIIPCLLALLVGLAGFKSKVTSLYFALINLAVALSLQQLALRWYSLTGGTNGIISIPRPTLIWRVGSMTDLYYFTILVVFVFVILAYYLVNSKMWHVVKAIKLNENKVNSIGYNPIVYKLIVSAVFAGIGGLCGALYAPITGIVHPDWFGVSMSMQMFVWVALGGGGTLLGPFFAALAIKLIENSLSGLFVQTYVLFLGIIFIVVVMVMPKGFTGFFKALFAALAKNKNAPEKVNI